jgi:hypothetical protein
MDLSALASGSKRGVGAATTGRLQPVPGILPPLIDVKSIKSDLDRFNTILALTPDLSWASPNSEQGRLLQSAVQDHTALTDSLAELRQLFGKLKTKVDALSHQIYDAAIRQAINLPLMRDSPYWYAAGDLLGMPVSDPWKCLL